MINDYTITYLCNLENATELCRRLLWFAAKSWCTEVWTEQVRYFSVYENRSGTYFLTYDFRMNVRLKRDPKFQRTRKTATSNIYRITCARLKYTTLSVSRPDIGMSYSYNVQAKKGNLETDTAMYFKRKLVILYILEVAVLDVWLLAHQLHMLMHSMSLHLESSLGEYFQRTRRCFFSHFF